MDGLPVRAGLVIGRLALSTTRVAAGLLAGGAVLAATASACPGWR